MDVRKIRITNERLWDIEQNGEDIDEWLRVKIGFGNWTEHIGINALPYRSFSFKDPRHETLFVLRWS